MKNITKAFVISEADAAIIAAKARQMGNTSDSAAVRAIIREWARMTGIFSQPTDGITIEQAMQLCGSEGEG